MSAAPAPGARRWRFLAALAFVLLVSYFTYVDGYDYPPAFFWDENYHIPSAQKYLNQVHFMEPHPPLGKLLIALGERALRPNARTDQFLGTDYTRELPPEFSFAGYRLLPVLLAWATAGVVFAIFARLTGNLLFALLLSFLYVFDNALIVHLRGAMLEGPLLFFTATTILLFLAVLDARHRPRRLATASGLFGVSLGLAVTVKLVALVLVLLVPAAALRIRSPRALGTLLLLSAGGFLLASVAVWQTHFALGSRLEPRLRNEGYYHASDAYRRLLAEGRTASLAAFPLMLRDSLRFVRYYEQGVPKLDLCKPGENGSPFYAWPLGARTISYRWESVDGYSYRYLYLVPNPAGWAAGLLGVAMALALVLAPGRWRDPEARDPLVLTAVFLGLYLAYMVAIARVDRVMYLYHYFIPLLLSFLLLGLGLTQLRRLGPLALTEPRRSAALHGLAILVLLAHHVYRPLTYYQPLTDEGLRRRAVVSLWDLRCARCQTHGSVWCREPAAAKPAP